MAESWHPFDNELQQLRDLGQAPRLARAVEMFFSGRPWSSMDWARWKALTNTNKPTPQTLLNLASVVK